MKKKILISIGAIAVVLIGVTVYLDLSSRNLSPRGVISYNKNGLYISVTYGRPYKKGRLIFGKEDQAALVPYDKYWRLGANEATEILFSKDVLFGGKPVKAGSYRMYAIPSENMWTVVLNSELGQWGAWEADHKLDVVKVQAIPVPMVESLEQFTIEFAEAEKGILLSFKWDQTKISVPVK